MQPNIGIAATTALWTMVMWSLVFVSVIGRQLSPLARAGYRITRHQMYGHDAWKEWNRAFDAIYLNLNISLAKPWAVALLFASLCLMGGGYGFGATGDVAMMVSPRVYPWMEFADRALDCVSAIGACIGMAGVLASISNRPKASVLMSLGFTLSGIGIGVTVYYKF